jgi:hypothetical protein
MCAAARTQIRADLQVRAQEEKASGAPSASSGSTIDDTAAAYMDGLGGGFNFHFNQDFQARQRARQILVRSAPLVALRYHSLALACLLSIRCCVL